EAMKHIVAAPVLSLVCFLVSGLVALGGEKGGSVTGTYKDALRKAGEAGKPVMLKFYSKDQNDCKRLEATFAEIPETTQKFVSYEINFDTNKALVEQFHVEDTPTIVFLKPDG